MEPIGDPVSIGLFQTPYPSGKCENQDGKQVGKCEKDSYLYGTLLWVVDMERDSYLLFFFSGGGGSGFPVSFLVSLELSGNHLRRGIEHTTTDEYMSRILKYRGRIGGHIALNGSEIAIFSVISLEIGVISGDLVLGDYRGILIDFILPSGRLCLFASV